MCQNCQRTFGEPVGLPASLEPVADHELPSNVDSLDLTCEICGGSPASKQPTATGETICAGCFGENYFHCSACDEYYAVDDREQRHNQARESFCEECYNESYDVCERCDTEIDRDNDCSYTPDNGRYRNRLICESCHDDFYTRCAGCDETYPTESMESGGDDYYCSSCWSERYSHCDDCGETIHNDYAYSRDGGTFCESCDPGEEESDEWEPEGFHIPADDMAYANIKSRRKFGVELETSKCDGYREIRGRTVFAAKEDGSITGMEFVSPPLAGDRGLRAIDDFCEAADDHHFSVDSHCGFHAHFDVGRLSLEQRKRVAKAYKDTESVWRRFVSQTRQDNTYCRPIAWSRSDIDAIDDDSAFRSFCAAAHRYQWLNVNAYSRHKTFEVRLHSATLSPEKIKNWVKAHARFIDAVAEMTDTQAKDRFGAGDDNAKFAAISEVWGDAELTAYYEKRSAHFGKPVYSWAQALAV